jgi:hypothetical protein
LGAGEIAVERKERDGDVARGDKMVLFLFLVKEREKEDEKREGMQEKKRNERREKRRRK